MLIFFREPQIEKGFSQRFHYLESYFSIIIRKLQNGSGEIGVFFPKSGKQPKKSNLRPTPWFFEEIWLFQWNLSGWPDMIHLIK
jgi:hypothetical protein